MSAYAEVRRAPAAELRTSLGLATLAAALTHVMGASHAPGGVWPAGVGDLAMALVQGAFAAGLAFTAARWVVGPAAAVDATIALVWLVTRLQGLEIGVPGVLGTLTGLVAAAGALALLLGAGDRALSAWSKAALAVFTLAACTGFGHVGH
ncbi:hypothetical protein [Candidatus Solirubrobacter pratensis]|uniref:hypothetical protein n=1 Tax=Candidatus Solirubrobacter pratensis TaxID=1298857 RepID=UPI0004877D28|nr:hypothetical protein [Candidatus Solirubrobacter pratensis]